MPNSRGYRCFMEMKNDHYGVPDEVFHRFLEEMVGHTTPPRQQLIIIKGPGVHNELVIQPMPHRTALFRLLRRYLLSIQAESFSITTDLILNLKRKDGGEMMECPTLCSFMGHLGDPSMVISSKFVPVVYSVQSQRWVRGIPLDMTDKVIDDIALACDAYLLFPNDLDKPLPQSYPRQIQFLIDDFGRQVANMDEGEPLRRPG